MLSQIAFSSLLFLFISKETQMTFFFITIMIVLLQVLFSLYLLYFIFSNFLKPHPLTPVNQLSGTQLHTELPMKHKSRVCHHLGDEKISCFLFFSFISPVSALCSLLTCTGCDGRFWLSKSLTWEEGAIVEELPLSNWTCLWGIFFFFFLLLHRLYF